MITIALGTTSAQKVSYLKEVLLELGISAKVMPVDVPSGVSNQPITSEETKRGAMNRAKGALRVLPRADYALGVEVGYHKVKGGYEMFCWATVIAGKKSISRQSHALLLPRYHQSILKKKLNLGDHLDPYEKKNKSSVAKKMSAIIRYRKPFIENAITNALLAYFVGVEEK